MKHLPSGGSTIGRTIKCPGWLKNINKLAKRPAGQAANLGNLLHNAMENYYQHGISFEDQIGKTTYEDLTLADEHLPILYKMLHATEQVLDTYNIDQYLCEPFVQYLKDEAGGSIDMLGVSADGSIALVLDYKTGHGAVSAHKLPQLYFYALCATVDPKTSGMLKNVTRFVSAVVQPYVHGDEADIYEYHNDELAAFRVTLDEAIQKTDLKYPPLVAGEHCLFCPKAAICTARRDQAQQAYLISPKDANALNESLALAKQLKSWCDEVLEYAKFIISEGGNVPGYKLVEGRKTRVWADEKQAESQLVKDLHDAAYSKKLLSPTQAMTAIKKAKLDPAAYDALIDFKAAAPVIAEEADKREAIQPTGLNKNLTKFFTKEKA